MRVPFMLASLGCLICASAFAADWPQWRGLNRDAKAEFKAPATWPKELTKKWSVSVGDGAATPALVGDRLYVFARQENGEVIRCLDAATGKEIWQDKIEVQGSTDPGGFVGPRSSPAVAEGKVITMGGWGIISCWDAAAGKKLWTKDDYKSWPQFFASSSPIIVDGMCVAQLGGDRGGSGAIVAYDLATGNQKWKVDELPNGYSSPVLMTVGGTKLLIAQVMDGIVGINVADGKKLWEKFFEGGGSRYKAATPIAIGDTLIYLDGPATAIKLEKQGDKFVDSQLWTNPQNRVEYNTPVVTDGLVVGLSGGMGSGAHQFFCLDLKTGKANWASAAPRMAGGPPAGSPGGKGPPEGKGDGGSKGPPDGKGFGGKGGFGKGGFGGKGGGGMRADAGYGSIVAAGSVLVALTPNSDLTIFEPTDKEFKKIATYKVAEGYTYAYPVLSGNRIYIKDKDAVTLWTVE